MPSISEAVKNNQDRIAKGGITGVSNIKVQDQSPDAPGIDGAVDLPRRGAYAPSMSGVDDFEKTTGLYYGRMRARVLSNPGGDLPQNASIIGLSKTTTAAAIQQIIASTGLNFRGTWNFATTYNVGDVVVDNLSTYVAIAKSLNQEPDKGNTSNWTLLGKNLNFRGVWVYPTATIRQNVSASTANGTATSTPFTLAVLQGSTIIVSAMAQNIGATTIPSVSDSQGNFYTQVAASPRVDSNEYQCQTWVASAQAGPLTVNVSWTGGTSPGQGVVFSSEIVGLSTNSVDQVQTAGLNTTSGAFPSMSLAVTNPGELIYTAASNQDASLSAPSGYSSDVQHGNGAIAFTQSSVAGNNTVQWGGSFNASNTRFTATAVSLFVGSGSYNPFDYVEFQGSMWVCVQTTNSAPSLTNSSWQLLAQGLGFANVQTVSYTATAADQGRLIIFNSASAVTLTLPAAPPNSGWCIATENVGAGALTVSPNGLTLDGGSSSFTLGTNLGIFIFTDGSNYFTFRGVGSPFGGVNPQTVNYTAVLGDTGKLVSMNGSNLTLTLPSTPPTKMWAILVENLNATNLTVSPNGLTIDGSGSSLTLGQNQGLFIFTDGTNYFTFHGVNRITVPSFLTVTGPDGSGLVTIGSATVAPSAAVIGPTQCSASGPLSARQIQGNDLANLNIASAFIIGSTINQSGNLRLCSAVLPAGQYRVSVYVVVTAAGTGNLSATITWNDGTSSQSFSPSNISTTVLGTIMQFDIVVLSDGIHDISFSFALI